MRKVLFWRDIVSDMSELKDYEVTIDALLNGEYSNLSLEKLNINTVSPIYSIRHDYKTRIIFTTHQQSICILEVIHNHDYAKSRFLRNRHCLKHFLEKKDEAQAAITTTPVETPEIPSYKNTPYEKKFIEFQQHFIELSELQEETLRTSFPFVLHGPAGSGKTTLAILLLKNFVRNNIRPVIYLTVSKKLKDYVQNLWHSMNPEEIRGIEFMTYEDFMVNILNVEKGVIVSEDDYSNWYQSLKKCPFSELQLHQEFRILSGYQHDLDKYLSLGERQSLIPAEVRPKIIELFQLYQRHLDSNLSKELSLIAGRRSDFHVVIDEAQDLSYAQLENVLNFAGPQAAILLGDHQVLFDGVSRHPFIKQFYYENYRITDLQTIDLPTSYRCCEQVTMVANEIVKLKYQVTGGALDKIETCEMLSDLREPGLVQWFDAQPHQLEALKNLASNPNCALINFSNEPNDSFTNFLVFNPYEIKGLEYDTIILWNPFHQTQAISKILYDEPTTQHISGHRAKSGQANFEHLHYFNRLITSVTRAKKRLVFVHPKSNDKHHVMVNKIRSICSVIHEWQEDANIPYTEADWLQHARQLLDLGYDKLAEKIFIQKLNRPIAVFETFKRNTFQTQSFTTLNPISPNVTPPLQISPVSVAAIKTPSPPNNAIEETKRFSPAEDNTAESMHHMLQSKPNYGLLAPFFETQTALHIRKQLTYKVNKQSAIDIICEDKIAFQNCIFLVSMNHMALNKILAITPHLISQIKNNKHPLLTILSLIKKYSDLCGSMYQYTLLHIATEAKNHEIMRLCLQNGAQANFMAKRVTPAHLACQKGSLSMDSLRMLKEYGARFDILDSAHYLPLHYAIENGHEEMTRFFIEEKINLNAQTKGLHRPLSIAVLGNHIKIFELLIQNGANPLLELDEKSCIVYLLIEEGLVDYFKVLVKHGFNLETPLLCGYSIADIAALKNQLKILEYLKEQGVSLINAENPEKLTPLHIAAKEGNIQAVRFFLESNISPNICAPEFYNITPAHLAAQHNRLQVLELLLEFHANFNPVSNSSVTPIQIAAVKKHFAVFEFLLKKGNCGNFRATDGRTIAHCIAQEVHHDTIDYLKSLKKSNARLDIPDRIGHTPLLCAMMAKNHNAVEFLLQEKVSLMAQDIHGNTTLHFAAEKDFPKVIDILIARGCDLNFKNLDGHSPLHLALNHKNTLIAEKLINADAQLVFEDDLMDALFLALENELFTLIPLILQKGNNNPRLFTFKSFIKAVRLGQLELIQKMLDGHFSINGQDEHGFAAIHHAINNKQVKVIDLLAKNGADLNMFDSRKSTPLFYACLMQHIPSVITLLKNGANPNIPSLDCNKTPLIYLSEINNTLLIKKLLEYPIEIDFVDNKAYSSLMIACYKNHIETVEILLKAHANPNRKNIYGNSSVTYAVKNFNIAMLNLLIRYQGKIDIVDGFGYGLLHVATMFPARETANSVHSTENLAMVEDLIHKKLNLNEKTPKCMTPIMVSIEKRNEPCFDLLLQHHAELMHVNVNGENCLHLLATDGSVSWFEKLLRLGLDIEAKTHQDETPLVYAFKSCNFELIDYLIEVGADVMVRDKNGKNLLHWACEFGRLEYIKLFLSKGLDLHTPDMTLNSPLDYAILNNHPQATRFLLSLGAQISSPICLAFARNKQWVEMIEILEKAIDENNKNQDESLRMNF
jgi:ankyrin repeat protein